jgi:hypothetical protein
MNYILAMADGLYCFYHRDGGVWFREFGGGSWSDAQELIPKAREDFTVNLVGTDEALLIWRDDKGNLSRGKFRGGDVAAEVMVAGKGELGQYRAMPADGGMNLVYSMPFSKDVHMLVSQFLGLNGAWGAVRRVDNISPMAGGLFNLVPIAGKHFLAVYQNSGFESRLGYREIYGGEVGKYNLIHSSIHKFGDCSVLATKYDLHVACVVRGVFGSRLIYKKRDAGGFSPGVVVSEGQDLSNVMLYMVDERLYLLFSRNFKLYCVSAQSGNGHSWSFIPLEERENERAAQMSKAVFLSNTSSKTGFLANELLVDEQKPWEIQGLSRHVLAPYTQNIREQTKENTEDPEKPEENYDDFFNNMEKEMTEFLDNRN